MQEISDLPMATTSIPLASAVTFKTSSGIEGQATVARLTPHSVSFEMYGPGIVLRVSEVLNDFEILAGKRPVYSGKAVVSSLVNTGTATACEAALPTPLPGWGSLALHDPEEIYLNGFGEFLKCWQKFYRLNHDYKVVIADLQTFLSSLRLWLEQVELTLQASASMDRTRIESDIAHGLRSQVASTLGNIFERFEAICARIEPDFQAAHRAFGQRQLHPHLLCAPFIHRTYAKPLGYAGDYEMMNMIFRNGLEGNSLYAKLTNAYLLDQIGPQAVRNRADYLCGKITEETCRIARLGRTARIYNIACGPAREVENFLSGHPLADCAEFHLLDFDSETLGYAGARMEHVKKRHHLKTSVALVKKSVHQMLKANGKPVAGEEGYDLIYCSGLYDYLNDRVVKAVNTYLYDHLRPGGLLTVGNFAPNMPVRNFIEHFLEWFLIYRDARQLAALAPEQVSPNQCKVVAEPTGTNIFLEVRKPL
ncbi:MAG TPA: class I SAM-dependent methyltransferase [Verrucomicrobiae bacterium]|nr:class I SAM-dependent methyltransferase [Verrucomicrobiae bacterium]